MAALLIYILSIGPVAYMARTGFVSKKVEVFYWPLLATTHLPVLGPQIEKCLEAYCYLWGKP